MKPIVSVDTSAIRVGKFEALKVAMKGLAAFVEANVPQLISYGVLRNGTFLRWEAAGCSPPGKRPGEHNTVAKRGDGRELPRYAAAFPLQGFSGAELLDCALYVWSGADPRLDPRCPPRNRERSRPADTCRPRAGR